MSNKNNENNEKKIELTKEILDSTNYFKLKDLLEKSGVGAAFKGGAKKSNIIKAAMKMFSDLKSAKAKDSETTEPFTYTTDEDGNMVDAIEIENELNSKDAIDENTVIEEGCNENCDSSCENCNKVSEKEGRSVEEIEKHIEAVQRSMKNGIESHRKHWGERLNELGEELENAK